MRENGPVEWFIAAAFAWFLGFYRLLLGSLVNIIQAPSTRRPRPFEVAKKVLFAMLIFNFNVTPMLFFSSSLFQSNNICMHRYCFRHEIINREMFYAINSSQNKDWWRNKFNWMKFNTWNGKKMINWILNISRK